MRRRNAEDDRCGSIKIGILRLVPTLQMSTDSDPIIVSRSKMHQNLFLSKWKGNVTVVEKEANVAIKAVLRKNGP